MKHSNFTILIFFFTSLLIQPSLGLAGAASQTLTGIPKGAQEALQGFTSAWINADVNQFRRYLHPLELKGHFATVEGTAKFFNQNIEYRNLPERMEYGEAEYYSDANNQLYFVPYVWIQKGFPADVRQGSIYLVASFDAGKTWKILRDCGITNENIKKLAPGYKGEPSLKKLLKNADDLAKNPFPHSSI